MGGNYDPDVFKLYFADTGLLVSMLDEESQEDLRANKNLGVYKGALYENMVGEALVKQGYKLYYYKRPDSTLEEDFFIRLSVIADSAGSEGQKWAGKIHAHLDSIGQV